MALDVDARDVGRCRYRGFSSSGDVLTKVSRNDTTAWMNYESDVPRKSFGEPGRTVLSPILLGFYGECSFTALSGGNCLPTLGTGCFCFFNFQAGSGKYKMETDGVGFLLRSVLVPKDWSDVCSQSGSCKVGSEAPKIGLARANTGGGRQLERCGRDPSCRIMPRMMTRFVSLHLILSAMIRIPPTKKLQSNGHV